MNNTDLKQYVTLYCNQTGLESERISKLLADPLRRMINLPAEVKSAQILPVLILAGWMSTLEEKEAADYIKNQLFPARMVELGAVFHLVLLASEIHAAVEESAEGDREQESIMLKNGYAILLGDYLYGKLLKRLCEIECTARVPMLAQVIATMNQGSIRRKQFCEGGAVSWQQARNYLGEEFSTLFVEAVATGYWLADSSLQASGLLSRTAFAYGLAWGSRQRSFGRSIITKADRELRIHLERITGTIPAAVTAQAWADKNDHSVQKAFAG